MSCSILRLSWVLYSPLHCFMPAWRFLIWAQAGVLVHSLNFMQYSFLGCICALRSISMCVCVCGGSLFYIIFAGRPNPLCAERCKVYILTGKTLSNWALISHCAHCFGAVTHNPLGVRLSRWLTGSRVAELLAWLQCFDCQNKCLKDASIAY